jgi:hypothetical protein
VDGRGSVEIPIVMDLRRMLKQAGSRRTVPLPSPISARGITVMASGASRPRTLLNPRAVGLAAVDYTLQPGGLAMASPATASCTSSHLRLGPVGQPGPLAADITVGPL